MIAFVFLLLMICELHQSSITARQKIITLFLSNRLEAVRIHLSVCVCSDVT